MTSDYSVLIVDDEKEIRDLLVELLSTEAFIYTVTATQGEDALKILQEKSFDLIITDLAMPKMNGFELIRRIRGLRILAPIFVLTGHADQKVSNQLKAFSQIQLIAKPFSNTDLKHQILMSLKSSQKAS